MEIKESYRVLELEVGATREAVEAAYLRLLERWHPDRVETGNPAAASEAQRMVQAVNDAYQTLVKIAPGSAPAPAAPPTDAPPAARAKPTLPPWNAAQQAATPRPPPPPAAPAAPAPAKPLPPPTPVPAPARAASTPPAAPAANRGSNPPKRPTAPPTPVAGGRGQAAGIYDQLFPVGSQHRRFGPLILAGAAALLILVVSKCVSKSPEEIRAAAKLQEAQTTGRLAVKSNRPNTIIEATRIPAASEAASSARKGSEEGAAEQMLATLPPGKYSVTARSAGWPDIQQEATVTVGGTTDVAINFKSGSLRLDSDPPGAIVRLGAAELGKTPLTIPQLPPGECELSVQYPSWPAVAFKATITENGEVAATVRLPHGKLVVESTPVGATVRMGARTIGKTPLTLDPVPAGANKVTVQAKDFPTMEATITVEDRGEAKLNIELGSGFPKLDPAALLRAVWVPETANKLAPGFDQTGRNAPKNGLVKNLNRKKLSEIWMGKLYRFSGVVKGYDRNDVEIEFAEDKSDLSRFRVLAKLSPEALGARELTEQSLKGTTITLYGRLSGAEEPRWPAKVITLELSAAELLANP